VTRVKICGLCREEDARHAAGLGADYLGFVLAESPRRLDLRAAAPWIRRLKGAFPTVQLVGVFVRPAAGEMEEAASALGLDLVQVHGLTPPARFECALPVIRACAPAEWRAAEESGAWAVLLDSTGEGGSGGTGRTWAWSSLGAARPERLFLAGGLDGSNVADAIRVLDPFAVDASSRLESAPGRKDPERVRAFLEAVRAAGGGAGGRLDARSEGRESADAG
jgi:phosphoribosylanthranilate isomerase